MHEGIQGLTFNEIVMRELGEIKSEIKNLSEKIDDNRISHNNRFAPLEKTHSRFGWLMGAAAGFGAAVVFLIEKIGTKWLNLF